MRRLFVLVSSSLILACPSPKDEVVVFAASSLQDVFPSLARAFTASHPNTTVTFSFAGSQELRTQLEHGAKADVFASADRSHLQPLEALGVVEPSRVFVKNELVVVLSEEASHRVKRIEQLPELERVAIGGPDVPIGKYTAVLFEQLGRSLGPEFVARVQAHVVSRELSVRQVLSRVSLGEAEAGVVYRTDAVSPSVKLSVLELPPGVSVEAEYPVAVLVAAPHPTRAREWADFLFSDEAKAIFRARGFRESGVDQ